MHILVTNDDGYDAPGIAALIEAVTGLGNVSVVAPLRNHSGASSSLTLMGDVEVRRRGGGRFVVAGTPTDCVHLALTGGFLPQVPDLIVSGVNDGANMGDDTIYSGTVAAAIEGHLFDVPAMAFSMSVKPAQHFSAGAAVARRLVQKFCRARPRRGGGAPLLNVNIPDLPASLLGKTVPTRLGRRHVAQPALLVRQNSESLVYRIGEAGAARDEASGTDFDAVRRGMVSVTPLMIDLTAAGEWDNVADWLAN